MKIRLRLLVFVSILGLLQTTAQAISLAEFQSGFNQITDFRFLSANLMVVTQKTGEMYLVDTDSGQKRLIKAFDVATRSEEGLLAVHPWQDQLIVYYTPPSGDRSRLARFRFNQKASDGNMLSDEEILIEISQPYNNHNGGGLTVDSEGMLYLGVGDGGSGGDPGNNGQDPTTILGSVLRIQLGVQSGYSLPSGNLNQFLKSADPHLFAMGLRNPWKLSMTSSGDLWIADVGQNKLEEINRIPADQIGRQMFNLGWNVTEGSECFRQPDCRKSEFWAPVADYKHEQFGQSITGGYLYEGTELRSLRGKYIFADFVSRKIGTLNPEDGVITALDVEPGANWTAFAVDTQDELYIADFRGTIYRFTAN